VQAHASSSRWRDPAVIISIVGTVIAILAAVYAREQAKIGDEQLKRETLIAKHRSLAVGIRVAGNMERALHKCLQRSAAVKDCGTALTALEDDVLQAAQDPEVATYYPLIHSYLEGLYFDAHQEHVEEALKTLRSITPYLDREARELDEFDAPPSLWHGADVVDDLEADVLMVKRFGGSGSAAPGSGSAAP
jgi:hypothetical protein